MNSRRPRRPQRMSVMGSPTFVPFAPAFFSPGPTEMVIIGIVAVLLFGSRLPSVARSLGRSFIEFKKGMSGVEDDVRDAMRSVPDPKSFDDDAPPSSPKFDPPQTSDS